MATIQEQIQAKLDSGELSKDQVSAALKQYGAAGGQTSSLTAEKPVETVQQNTLSDTQTQSGTM